VTARVWERDLVIVACAVSAGIHGALVHEHFAEGAGAGTGFLVSTILLAVYGVALTDSDDAVLLASTALMFTGLIAAYVLAVTTGVPVLHPEVEAVDGLALFTKAIELVGLAASLQLLAAGRAPRRRPILRTERTLT
jgi:hypothetical protein